MAAFRRGRLFLPSLIQCRTKKYNSRHPRPKLLERRIFEEITQPITADILKPVTLPCSVVNRRERGQKVEEENEFAAFLSRRCLQMFRENEMIAVYASLPIPARERRPLELNFLRQGFKCFTWSNQVVRETIKGTKWENLSPLFIQSNLFVTSPDNRVDDLIKVNKKVTDVVLIGGVLYGRLLSREGFLQAAALPAIDQLLGETSWLLGSVAGQTHSLLGRHQQTLSTNLTQYLQDQSHGQESSPSEEATQSGES